MLDIKKALKATGLDSYGVHVSFATLMNTELPVIAHMSTNLIDTENEINHWVIVTEILTDSVRLFDGGFDGRGSYVAMSFEHFKESWTGNILQVVEPERPEQPKFLTRVGQDNSFLKFDKVFIYAGDIPQSETFYDFIFPFQNMGTEDLKILNVKTSCSCTSVGNYKNTLIPPGGKGEIVIKYEFKDTRSRFAQSAIVHSNDPYSPYIELTLSGNGRRDITFSPSKLNFNAVVKGEKASGKIYVTSKGDSVFKIQDIASPEWVKVTAEEVTNSLIEQLMPSSDISLGERNIYLLTAEADTSILNKGFNYNVLTLHTNLKHAPSVNIPVLIEVTSDLRVIPEKFFVGGIAENEAIDREVRVKSLKGEIVEIVSVDAGNTGLMSVHSTKGDSAIVKIYGKYVNRKLANENIIITVKTGDKLRSIRLPISGIYGDSLVVERP